MVVYYIKKEGESLADYRYPIKEGDICMLYDGEFIKTVYIDSELDLNSIWRDFKFIDTKSLKSYQFPTSDSILCAPVGDKHAIGNMGLLTQLIKECKGEWLLDFLKETSAVLSGFVDYWDLGILRRLVGEDDVEITYENDETLSIFFERPEDNEEIDEYSEAEGDSDNTDLLPLSRDVKWFCLSALTCLEGLLDNRNYQILKDMLNGESKSTIALKNNLTQERVRQIVVKTTKQAKELLMEQRKSLEKEKENNARLNVQLNLLREDVVRLQALFPKEIIPLPKESDKELDSELVELLETPIEDIKLPVRAVNILLFMGKVRFSDIPQIESSMTLLRTKNSGRKTVHNVSCILEDFHLTFGMSFKEIVDTLMTNDWHAAKRKWIRRDVKKEVKGRDNVESGNKPIVGTFKVNQDVIENVKPEEATILLTRDIIEAARTPNGGFTKSQLSAIGINWPPPQDWINEKVGTMITPTQLEAFKLIRYVKELPLESSNVGQKTYKDVAFNSQDKRRMEIVLQAMTHFLSPVTPKVIACSIDPVVWGEDEVVSVDTVDSILKRLPEADYVKWGKYILKRTTTPNEEKKVGTSVEAKKATSLSDDKRIGYTVRLFPSHLKGEIIRVRINAKGIKKLVVKTTKGDIVEVDDLPYLYEVLRTNKTDKANTRYVESLHPTRKGSILTVGTWILWKPTNIIGKVVKFMSKGSMNKILLRLKNGTEIEVYDNPKTYEIIK